MACRILQLVPYSFKTSISDTDGTAFAAVLLDLFCFCLCINQNDVTLECHLWHSSTKFHHTRMQWWRSALKANLSKGLTFLTDFVSFHPHIVGCSESTTCVVSHSPAITFTLVIVAWNTTARDYTHYTITQFVLREHAPTRPRNSVIHPKIKPKPSKSKCLFGARGIQTQNRLWRAKQRIWLLQIHFYGLAPAK